jgi:hypothetical protein
MVLAQTFVLDLPNGLGRITILPGFVTDGASVPRIFLSLAGAPFDPRYLLAAVIHDAAYASQALPRSVCDQLFLDMMCAEDVTWIIRNVFWAAVRAGGWYVWSKHTPQSIAAARKLVSLTTEAQQ